MIRPGREMIPTRKTLLSRLKRWDDQESWNEFFELYWKLIYHAAVRSGLSDAEAQDVVQETVISVCKSMPGFRYDAAAGSFKSWLLRLTRWRIADQLRKRDRALDRAARHRRAETSTDGLEQIPDPVGIDLERLWDQEWAKNIVEAAMERVKRRADPKQYQLFDLYVLKQWPVKKIAQTLNLSPSAVYMARSRINALIRQEVRKLEAKAV